MSHPPTVAVYFMPNARHSPGITRRELRAPVLQVEVAHRRPTRRWHGTQLRVTCKLGHYVTCLIRLEPEGRLCNSLRSSPSAQLSPPARSLFLLTKAAIPSFLNFISTSTACAPYYPTPSYRCLIHAYGCPFGICKSIEPSRLVEKNVRVGRNTHRLGPNHCPPPVRAEGDLVATMDFFGSASALPRRTARQPDDGYFKTKTEFDKLNDAATSAANFSVLKGDDNQA